MLDRPIEQSHDIIVGRTVWKLTRHGEYQSSLRLTWLVELRVSARQCKCSDKVP
jgi:hypothetical protein